MSEGPQQTAAGRAHASAAASMAGGMRTAGRRPGRGGAAQGGKMEGAAASNPNNMLRFYSEQDGTGLKVGPVTVLVMSLSYMVIVVFLHIMSKFKSALSAA